LLPGMTAKIALADRSTAAVPRDPGAPSNRLRGASPGMVVTPMSAATRACSTMAWSLVHGVSFVVVVDLRLA